MPRLLPPRRLHGVGDRSSETPVGRRLARTAPSVSRADPSSHTLPASRMADRSRSTVERPKSSVPSRLRRSTDESAPPSCDHTVRPVRDGGRDARGQVMNSRDPATGPATATVACRVGVQQERPVDGRLSPIGGPRSPSPAQGVVPHADRRARPRPTAAGDDLNRVDGCRHGRREASLGRGDSLYGF